MAPGRQRSIKTSRVSQSSSLQREERIIDSQQHVPLPVVPSVSSTQPPSDASLQVDSSASSVTKKNCRGKTRGCNLQKLVNSSKNRLPIYIDADQGRPLDAVQSAKLSNEIGIIARTYLPCPRTIKKLDWEEHIKPAFDRLGMKLNIIGIETNPRIADCIVDILKNRIRDHRQSLKKYYLSFSSYEDAKSKKPNEFITQENWEDLCDYWNNDKTKEKAEKAKVSRSYMKTPHNQGSKSFVVVRHELMRKDDETGEQHECHRIELYKSTHYKEGKGWTSPEANANYCAMQQKLQKAIDENQDVDVDKICDEVLGNRSGYVKGLGYGPKPNASRCGHAKSIKDLEEEKNMWKERYEAEARENQRNRAQLSKHDKMLRQIMGAKYDDYDENSQSEDEQGDHSA